MPKNTPDVQLAETKPDATDLIDDINHNAWKIAALATMMGRICENAERLPEHMNAICSGLGHVAEYVADLQGQNDKHVEALYAIAMNREGA